MSKPRATPLADGVSPHGHGDDSKPLGGADSPDQYGRDAADRREEGDSLDSRQNVSSSIGDVVVEGDTSGEKSTSLSSQSSGTSPIDMQQRSLMAPGKPTETSKVKFHNVCICFIIVTLCAVGVSFLWDVETVKDKRSLREVMVETFDKEIGSLQEMFPAQEPRFWRVIKASTKRVLQQSDPSQPAILLLASDTAGESTLNCLTKKLTSVISRTYDATVPFAEYRPILSSSSLSKEKGKIALDDALRNGFQQGSKVAVVRNLEQISGPIAMMLHAYCDHEDAPFTDVALLLTAHVGLRPRDIEGALTDKDVVAHLTDAWNSDLEVNSLSALMSRVANNIAVVVPQSESSLKNC